MRSLHQRRTHAEPVVGCFGCKAGTITFGVSAVVEVTDASERVLRKDLDSYKRLRQEGIQPPSIRGAYDSEQRADSKMEIEHPKLRDLDPLAKEYLHEAVQVATDIDPSISRFADTA